MKSNLYIELSDRTKQIFKSVVESYLETGSPSGSEAVLKRAGLDYWPLVKKNGKKSLDSKIVVQGWQQYI